MDSEEIVIEPFSLSDIKCNASNVEHNEPLPLETDETQVKYFSAAMGALSSKRKRDLFCFRWSNGDEIDGSNHQFHLHCII